MKYFIIILLLVAGYGVGMAQSGCNIFPKTKKDYHHKSPFLSGTYIEGSSNLLTAYDQDVDGLTNTYLLSFYLGIAQKIKKRVVLHLALGGGTAFDRGSFAETSYGSGKIGIDYFFDSSMNGFGIGIYGHGITYTEEEVAIPMFHLMYAKSSKKLFNQYHFSIFPTAEAVVFGAGISIGFKAY